MSKKKLLFFINTLSSGGAEKSLICILNNIDKNKFEVSLLTLKDIGVYKDYLNSDIEYNTIIKNLNSKFDNFFYRVLLKLIKISNCKLIYNFFIKGKYDVEIAFLEGIPTKIIGCTRGNSNVKKIAWVHTDMIKNNESEVFYKNLDAQRKNYLNFDKIICVSKECKERFSKKFDFYTDKVFVQYNLLDEDEIIKSASEEVNDIQFSKNVLNVCSIGRLVDAKGYDLLLKATKRLIDENINFNLYIIGDGEKKESLNKYIQDNKLYNNVYLLGFKCNPYKYLQQCDIAISSSRYEGMSLFICEALILKKVILSTKCTGPLEILENGKYGLLMDNSEQGIYDGLKCILTDKKKYYHYSIRLNEYKNIFEVRNGIREIEEIILN